MFKIAIPKPCHEDWNAMTPNQQGRYCNACAKSVTDFTTMSDEAIKDFFLAKKDEKVCGRFKNEQLSRIVIDLPENILYIDMPLWKKFLVACLIVFSSSLFSCDTTINGKQVDEQQVSKTLERVSHNKNTNHDIYVGGLSFTIDSSYITPITIPINCGVTYGYSTMIPADTLNIVGDTEVIIVHDSIPAALTDSISSIPAKQILDSNMILKTDSLKTKNPPMVDSINCDQSIFTNL
jgi:hypothetical protein